MVHKVGLLIVGAGPCGLGGATRLEQLRADGVKTPSYLVVDARSGPGGWASSVTTPEGFTFDYGGHVLFLHRSYPEYIKTVTDMVDAWHCSVPKRGVWIGGRLVPYPIQRNIQRLRVRQAIPCFVGLLRARALSRATRVTRESLLDRPLSEYLESQFGTEMMNLILGPLNKKMWACPIGSLESSWVECRSGSDTRNVPEVSLWKVLRNMLFRMDDLGWSPTTRVQYPLRGGTGALWSKIAARIPCYKLMFGKPLVKIDSERRQAHLIDGTKVHYGALISSIPLDILLRSVSDRPDLNMFANCLVWSRARLFGLGVEGKILRPLDGVHSFHVPDPTVPFWRVSFPAALSPHNVPTGVNVWSILCESSEPNTPDVIPADEHFHSRLVEDGLRKLGILRPDNRVVSRWNAFLEHGYPTPFRGRNSLLPIIQARLRKINIFSRGRFGGWRYEISNQDHAFMQGVEILNHLVLGDPEATYV